MRNFEVEKRADEADLAIFRAVGAVEALIESLLASTPGDRYAKARSKLIEAKIDMQAARGPCRALMDPQRVKDTAG